MTESPLDKVLRLAGGTTRSYVRMHAGRLQRVGAYPTPRLRHVAWGSLKAGQVVEIVGIRYEVLQVRVKPKLTTGSGTSTGSKGKGVNTKGPPAAKPVAKPAAAIGTPGQSPAKAAAAGQKVPAGAAKVTNELLLLGTTRRYFISLPLSQVMTVVG